MCPSRLHSGRVGRGDQKTVFLVIAEACNLEKCNVSGVCIVELRGSAPWMLELDWADSAMSGLDQVSVQDNRDLLSCRTS